MRHQPLQLRFAFCLGLPFSTPQQYSVRTATALFRGALAVAHFFEAVYLLGGVQRRLLLAWQETDGQVEYSKMLEAPGRSRQKKLSDRTLWVKLTAACKAATCNKGPREALTRPPSLPFDRWRTGDARFGELWRATSSSLHWQKTIRRQSAVLCRPWFDTACSLRGVMVCFGYRIRH